MDHPIFEFEDKIGQPAKTGVGAMGRTGYWLASLSREHTAPNKSAAA
jgi:hypothetical protein